MKRTYLLLLASLIAYLAHSSNDTLKVQSEIQKVTVFLRGGEIIRNANVRLPNGTVRILFDKLSPHIDINSIQLKSKQEITILSVVHQYNFLELVNKPEREKTLEKRKTELKDDIELEQSMIGVYKQEEQLILSNKKLSRDQLGVNIEELKKAAPFREEIVVGLKISQIHLSN